MSFQCKKLILFYLFFFHHFFELLSGELTVKVAVVHFQPTCHDIENNVARLSSLAIEAGKNEAKIVVFPELATSGYSYFSRHEIQKVAESIPGKTTAIFSKIARKYEMYIVLGLPEYSLLTNQFYNSAVLIDPDGLIQGVYRKHSHLIESSWSSLGNGRVPIFETPYGKLAILICADINYPELFVQATLKDATFLILPTNGGVNEDLIRARAMEGNCHIILANRYGNELEEYLNIESTECFNEETLQIIPPFYYDFQDGKSVIVKANGIIDLVLEKPLDWIGYSELPLEISKNSIVKRPELYSLLGQNTLNSYVIKCMRLPEPTSFAMSTASLKVNNTEEALKEIKDTLVKLQAYRNNLSCKLVVFPADVLNLKPAEIDQFINSLRSLTKQTNVDIVLGLRALADNCPMSFLITKEGKSYCYKRLHRLESENIQTGDHFFVIDRDYARLALLQDKDLLISETTRVLAKMGVDLVAVSANMDDANIKTFAKVRSLDYLHIAMSNLNGSNGIYLGGFLTYPSFKEDNFMTIMQVDTTHVRKKKELKTGCDLELLLKHKIEPLHAS